jgi:hypothetical protein
VEGTGGSGTGKKARLAGAVLVIGMTVTQSFSKTHEETVSLNHSTKDVIHSGFLLGPPARDNMEPPKVQSWTCHSQQAGWSTEKGSYLDHGCTANHSN